MYQLQVFDGSGLHFSKLFDGTDGCYRYVQRIEPNRYIKITYGQEALDGAFEAEEVIASFWTED